jgi:hypothetical protein
LIGALVGGAVVGWFLFFTEWSFFWHGPIGCLATVAMGWLASIGMTEPTREKTWGLVVGYGDPGGRDGA